MMKNIPQPPISTTNRKATVIIVAGGSGARFESDTPKQYHLLNGEMVLRHTVKKFANHPSIAHISVVIGEGHDTLYMKAVEDLPKCLPPVYGGATRQQSVYNALQSLVLKSDDFVLIHDAARPCVSPECITNIINALDKTSAASLAIPVTDTLRKTDKKIFEDIIPRDNLCAMQTPQAFHFRVIKSAHENFKGDNMTDDTALVSAMGIDVTLVNGSRRNIKITTPEDMMIASSFLYPTPLIPRTAIGFDVHAFGDEATSIRMGGIDIPHTHKLLGHSDADVVLHAITDALYGAAAEGDIGHHFPPSDMKNKNKDSADFLKHAVKIVENKGGIISFIDCVIMCEAPKIGPYRDAMRERIADITQLPIDKISVKATTTEKLGFTGRGEGIAAQAIATIMMKDI